MPVAEQLAVGDVLDGKYRVEALIGRGGMGTVYRARHIDLDSPRAIKLMRPELALDAAFVQRFDNEAFLAEGVRHPNVVALYDFASLPDGTKYIVWELVVGETVRDFLERGTVFTSSEAKRLVTQIGGGLAVAHKKGILHRDVSPDNIMICADGKIDKTAKLLDFGVAKAAGTPTSMATTTGMVFGKIGYASPEQMGLLRGDESLDARTDVFSLAAVAYAMLTGKPPFVTTGMRSFLHDLMIAPEAEIRASYLADLEEPWRALLGRALARDRKERPPSMEAFVEQAREVAEVPQPLAGAIPPAHISPSKTLRYRILAIVALVGAVVAIFTLGPSSGLDTVPMPPPGVVVDRFADSAAALEFEETLELSKKSEESSTSQRSEPEPSGTAAGADDRVEPRISAAEPPDEAGGLEHRNGFEGMPRQSPEEPPNASEQPVANLGNDVSEMSEAPAADEETEALEPGPEPIVLGDPNGDGASDESNVEPKVELAQPSANLPTKPQLVTYVAPIYPPRAKSARLEGNVVVSIEIGTNGEVTRATVVESVHRDLDRAARQAVLQWKYEPVAVPVQMRVTIGFDLTK